LLDCAWEKVAETLELRMFALGQGAVISWRVHQRCWRGRQGSIRGKEERRGDQETGESCRGPKVARLDGDRDEGWGVQLEVGREEGKWNLQVEIGAGRLGGGPASPVGELVRGGPKLNEGCSTAAAEGMPGERGEQEAQGAIEGVGRRDRSCIEVETEEVKPLTDERGARAPAEEAVALGCVESEAGGAERGRGESGCLADSKKIDEGQEEEAVGSWVD
jgi:hypothetical protein